MGVNYLVVSAVSTVVNFIGLWCWTEISLEKFKLDGQIGRDTLYLENTSLIFELLLRSHATITLLAISVINAFLLFTLCLKSIFFGELYESETRKMVACLGNYIIYKGIFLPLIIPPTIFQSTMWFTWLTVLCFLKMFQALARDRLERLNASPSATSRTYIRVYSALLLVLVVDFLWVWYCVAVLGPLVSSTYWLLFFEPLSIAFETLQAMTLYGFQLMDIWLHYSATETSDCQRSKLLDSTLGSLREWKSSLVRNTGFFLDLMAHFMALGHYLLIWWLRGMAFQLVDAILFLNIQALLSTILKRINGFIKLKRALRALHKAFPDATSEEIKEYEDECAICREPIAKAKKLPCKHLFHLSCLKSWLDQSRTGSYSCPNCRKSLFLGRSENEASSNPRAVSRDEQLARQLRERLHRLNVARLRGTFPDQNQNSIGAGTWRGTGADVNRLQSWPNHGLDEAGPWSLWPRSTSQATTSITTSPTTPQRFAATPVHGRATSSPANESIANLLVMAETVREVLPHIPFEVFLQDLQRTQSVATTITNLLQA